MLNENDVYKTPDFWLSSALLAKGMRLSRLEWNGPRAFFVFENERRCEELSQAYWNRDLAVDAKTYADSERTLKDRIHSGKPVGV